MLTDSPFFPMTQTFSHWSSWGQTRPHTAGSALVSLSFLAASLNFPSDMSLMNHGMSMFTGHPPMQTGFLHCMQRRASSFASSGV